MTFESISQAASRFARVGPIFLVSTFIWAFTEATLFFIVADVLVGWVALHDAKRGTKAVVAALAGATAGALLLFMFPAFFLAALPHVPGVSAREVAHVGTLVQDAGWRAMLAGAWTGIPYKVFGTQLAASGASFATFIGATMLARFIRFAPVAIAFYLVGRLLRRRIDASPRLAFGCVLAFWAVLYAYYFAVVAPSLG